MKLCARPCCFTFVSEARKVTRQKQITMNIKTFKMLCLLTVIFILGSFSAGKAQSTCAANFNWNGGEMDSVYMGSTSTGTDTTTLYSWSFGDGQTATGLWQQHHYGAPGKYVVCLNISVNPNTSSACTSSFCDTVVAKDTIMCHVYVGLQAVYASCMTCTNGKAFVNYSYGNQGAMTYSWSGAGITGNQSSVSGLSPGNTYTLNVIDSLGCQASATVYILSTDTNCHASFTKTQVSPNTVQFTNTSMNTSQNTTVYWNFGDGSGLNPAGSNPQHTYNIPGTYTVCMSITDSSYITSFCNTSFCDTVKVTGTVICNLNVFPSTSSPSCPSCADGIARVFSNGGTAPFTYSWAGSSSVVDSIYGLAAGTYHCCVTDANGCTACDSAVIAFSCNLGVYTSDVLPSCTTCTDGTATVFVYGGNAPYTYAWSVNNQVYPGNGATITGLASNPYTACVTDANGCQACATATVIPPHCNALFTLQADTSSAGDYIAVNHSYGVGALSYIWNWGDGTIDSAMATPTHTYSAPGLYTICLYLGDASVSCSSQYCDTLNAMRLPAWIASHHTRVNVVNPSVLGIAELKLLDNWKVYPNPARGQVTVNYTLLQNSGIELGVYDQLGREVLPLENSSLQQSGSHQVTFNAAELQPGSYLVRIRSNDKAETQHIIILR